MADSRSHLLHNEAQRCGVPSHCRPTAGDMPSLNLLIGGQKGLPGPPTHYGLDRSGKAYVVAEGPT